jgi:predicted nucleotidyltransferase
MADTRLDDPILAELVTRLRAAFQPECIYLFGSHARGEAGPDSDYDLLMVLPSSPMPRYQREQVAFRALAGMGISKDILVLTRAEFDRHRNALCSLSATVEREGVLLYAA